MIAELIGKRKPFRYAGVDLYIVIAYKPDVRLAHRAEIILADHKRKL